MSKIAPFFSEVNMAYQGYLIKVGNYTIPTSVMRAETYKALYSTLDLDSTRLADGTLRREVLDHHVGKVEFETLPLMDNVQMTNLLTGIQNNYTNALEKKANVTFYVPETDSYITQEMYVPDITFTMYLADSQKIQYEQTRIAFIGY